MKNTAYLIAFLLASAILSTAGCAGDSSKENARDRASDSRSSRSPERAADYAAELDAWHADRIERLRSENGWLTLVGLHRLEEGENRIGSGSDNAIQLPGDHPALIGTIHAEGAEFLFESAEGVEVRVGDEPVDTLRLATDGEGTGDPTVLQVGSLSFYVIQRGADHYLRSKDSASELRRSFEGIERYPTDESWRVVARRVPFEEPRMVEIPNVLGTREPNPITGELVFTLKGEEYRLLPMGEADEGQFVVFGDAGNGVTSYGGGRFLYTEVPEEDGTVILDFNRAYNPPCAFTPYATCPLPPEGNVLPFEVTAGEKNWGENHH